MAADYATNHLLLGGLWALSSDHLKPSYTAARYWFLHFRRDKAAASASFLTLFGFAFTVILNFLQLKYQNQGQKSPFQTHPRTMNVAVASLLAYCFLHGIHQRFSYSSSHPLCYRRRRRASAATARRLIAPAKVFFALLALLSTASVLFPESVRGVLYALCILLSAGDCLHALFRKIKNRFNMIMRIMRFPSVEQRLNLPI